ncbi:MAG TPA: tRNA (N6-isopentenyl adenosine(37)-C2)-methylthiotransferase MiaB, partial [Stenotrophomonas sp.]|nr:tRNA (N6-isopentenyl adenosine(37)-C2)-methylthiotransferase MiaB [Stenotrophomonas sp.]
MPGTPAVDSLATPSVDTPAPAPALIPLPGSRKAVPGGARGKLYIKTHGCQMNEYDSAKMADVLAEAEGLELTEVPEEADVILINTCSIREKAQEKVF